MIREFVSIFKYILGVGKTLSASERLKLKKKNKQAAAEQDAQGTTDTPVAPPLDPVAGVTEVANAILSATGNMDIYQETYESIQFKVQLRNFIVKDLIDKQLTPRNKIKRVI